MAPVRPGEVILIFLEHVGADIRRVLRVPDTGKIGEVKERETFVGGRCRLQIMNPEALHETRGARALAAAHGVPVAVKAETKLVEEVRAHRMRPTQGRVLAAKVDRVAEARERCVTESGIIDVRLAEQVTNKKLVAGIE